MKIKLIKIIIVASICGGGWGFIMALLFDPPLNFVLSSIGGAIIGMFVAVWFLKEN